MTLFKLIFICLITMAHAPLAAMQATSVADSCDTCENLFTAVGHNCSACCKRLLEDGACPNQKSQFGGSTPLHKAVLKKSYDIVQQLLENGAHANAINDCKKSPLHLAAWNNSVDIAQLLIQHGATLNLQDSYSSTALHVALFSNAVAVAELLLIYGANPNERNDYGYTPLHMAAWKNAHVIVERLFSLGADPHQKNMSGNTPLHEAAAYNADAVAKVLLAKDPNLADEKNNDGKKPSALARNTKLQKILQHYETND